jgi:hypothetical protein
METWLRSDELSPTQLKSVRPPVYDAFSPEDRELFLACKREFSPVHLGERLLYQKA